MSIKFPWQQNRGQDGLFASANAWVVDHPLYPLREVVVERAADPPKLQSHSNDHVPKAPAVRIVIASEACPNTDGWHAITLQPVLIYKRERSDKYQLHIQKNDAASPSSNNSMLACSVIPQHTRAAIMHNERQSCQAIHNIEVIL